MDNFNSEKLDLILQQRFGFKSFRPLQRETIENVLQGKDSVVLMPTGGGKSICYQLPAILLDGLTVVISPLIALMKDQVESLEANGIEAAFLNSTLSKNEEYERKQQLANGKIKLLYVAPERILSSGFIEYLNDLDVKLIAIDEAHCISSWGHHFRPEYQQLDILKEKFPEVPFIALTATADKAVRSDIGELLRLDRPKYFIGSFDRPNLSLAVLPGQKKWQQIIKIVRKHHQKSGIIYCTSRASTETMAAKLVNQGISAAHYHAGLETGARSKTQDDFILGKTKVICATVAFGMGIDKADIRFVIHHNMPGNVESYYQEIGRAGRDGLPAETILFYSYRDVQTHVGFIEDVDNVAYKKILLAKLDRIKEYAEAQVCRRKILLSYFCEMPKQDCGNCDVCSNPPNYFNGTIEAQMALSAVSRCKERVGVSTLIDVLKGKYSLPVNDHKLFGIKTFGAGKKTTAFAWVLFIQQLIQQGFLEIDYKDHYYLKLTPLSREVLKNDMKVRLVTPETIKERQEIRKEEVKTVEKPVEIVDESLFQHLRLVRKTIADEIRKPAFVVFSDASLMDMCILMPKTPEQFMEVSGVGEYKAKRYAKRFLSAIDEYMAIDKSK